MSVTATSKRLKFPSLCRCYAISVAPAKPIKGMDPSRTFSGKKAYQYSWYTRMLDGSSTAPLLLLHHNEFSANRMAQLRRDITAAATRSKSKASKEQEEAEPIPDPHLTVIRSGIFGAALRDYTTLDNAIITQMIEGVSGRLAVLSLPVLDPPQLKAVLRTFDRTVPPKAPKTQDEIKKELEEKNADPANPGRRMKRMRPVLHPELKVLGAFMDGQVLLLPRLNEVSQLPTLQTLREQIVGPPPFLLPTMVQVPAHLPPPKPDHSFTRRPESPIAVFFWRRRMWFESTFVLSMLEPWEKILLCIADNIRHPIPPSLLRHCALPASPHFGHERPCGILPLGTGGRRARALAVAWIWRGRRGVRFTQGAVKWALHDRPNVFRDDDDDFLYGGGDSQPTTTPAPIAASTSYTVDIPQEQGIIEELQAAEASGSHPTSSVPIDEDQGSVAYETTDDEEDVEILMEPQSRSLDFRQANARLRASATSTPAKTAINASSETTDYTPLQRGASLQNITPSKPPTSTSQPQSTPSVLSTPVPVPPPPQTNTPDIPPDGVDPATLPQVTAPPSHPAIDPTVMGTTDGRAIIDVDLSAMTDKAWRRPGSDISDWFNYGFDELSWEAYCYRRRDLGELANVLKTNVLNFSGLNDDQLIALPTDARTMVMTGTQAMMNGAMNGAVVPGGPGMMGMMDMSGMMPMGMPVGMNNEMAMMAMQDPSAQNGGVVPEQAAMQDGFANQGMMGMEYAQDQGQQQQLYSMEGNATPTGPAMGRGAVPFRGTRGLRGVRGFVGRGRGRGGYDAPAAPARPTSPLPPNVPTGPRNQNKYKDRDGNAAAVDGLDYGGGKGDRTPSGEPEERGRKRRGSPSSEDRRDSKRR
ncbi:Fip1 domain-containing protein [Mycena indigotica]|uniref:Fip1 domain-containing protein n=1 Tax=Mycena indigotica TaxID=2126181 RepID=A0A8H6WA27_9AGAR|nr:Fip1 domain-containing protein [Mycena indigotica]KAF7307263.1 Fip1 domain-containing protein [Mycena indigotica]